MSIQYWHRQPRYYVYITKRAVGIAAVMSHLRFVLDRLSEEGSSTR